MTLSRLLLALILIAWPGLAIADGCTQLTIMNGNGTMTFCTQCCYGGSCTITCL